MISQSFPQLLISAALTVITVFSIMLYLQHLSLAAVVVLGVVCDGACGREQDRRRLRQVSLSRQQQALGTYRGLH